MKLSPTYVEPLLESCEEWIDHVANSEFESAWDIRHDDLDDTVIHCAAELLRQAGISVVIGESVVKRDEPDVMQGVIRSEPHA